MAVKRLSSSGEWVQLNVLVRPAMRDNLAEESERRNESISELVRKALYRYESKTKDT